MNNTINDRVSSFVDWMINENPKLTSKKAKNKLIDKVVMGPVTYDVWKTGGKFKVMKSVLPYAKNSEKEYVHEFDSEEMIVDLMGKIKELNGL